MTSKSFLGDVADFESMMSLDDPIKSSVAPRWERKARQAQQQLSSSLSASQPSQSDRYIPNRSGMDFDLSSLLADENTDKNDNTEHSKLLAETLDKESSKGSRILAFKNKAPAPADGFQSSLRVLYSASGPKKEVAKPTRTISSTPFRVLDAPDMLDDYCKLFSS